jgi:hypothetical protein
MKICLSSAYKLLLLLEGVETTNEDLLVRSTSLQDPCSSSLGRMPLAGGPSASSLSATAAATASAKRSRR